MSTTGASSQSAIFLQRSCRESGVARYTHRVRPISEGHICCCMGPMMLPPRFRITDVLFLTAAVGLGCGAAQLPNMSWLDGAFVTMSVLIATITGRECVALYKARETHRELSKDQRAELSLLAWGRLSVLVIFATVLVLDLSAKSSLIDLPEGDFHQLLGRRSRGAVVDLALLISICSPTFLLSYPRKSFWRSTVNRLALGAAGLLAILLVCQDTFIHFLVYIAVRGVERGQTRSAAAFMGSEGSFAYSVILLALAVLPVVGAVHFVATHWRASRLRYALLLFVPAALAAIATSAIRLVAIDLRDISPAMYEGIAAGPIHRWVMSIVLIIMGCSAWTYLVVRRSRIGLPAVIVPIAHRWQTRALPPAMVLLLYTLNGAFVIYYLLAEGSLGTFGWNDPLWTLATTDHYLSIALWLAAAVQLYRAWRWRKSPSQVELHGLPMSQYVTLALYYVATAAISGLIATWLAFALWLTPWYQWVG
jgi:hypothetical protein